MLQYNPSITGSLIVTGSINASQGITGSLSGTVDGINVTSFSSSIVSTVTSVSSSLLTVNGSTGSYATTGSNTFTGAQTVQGILTAQTLVVQTVTSSVLFTTGSNIIGSSLSNVQQITGSLYQTGSTAAFIGNVGIGTTSPSYNLDVVSTSDTSLFQVKSTASANNTSLRIGISGSNSFINATGGSTGILEFRTYGSARLTINASGKVSIGTTATHGNVTVEQTTGEAGIAVNSSIAESPKIYLRDAGGAGYSEISANNKLYLNASNVGIGTSSPARTLDVTGTFRVVTPNRSFFVTTNAYSISDGTLSSGIGMDGDGIYLGNVTSSTGWTISNPQVTIRSSGNVGIGTVSPNSLLHIESSSTSGTKLRISQVSNDTYDATLSLCWASGDSSALMLRYNPSQAVAYIDTYQSDPGTAWGDLIFRSNVGGSQYERMRIKAYTGQLQSTANAPGNNSHVFWNSASSNAYGPWIKFSIDPNNGSNYYLVCSAVVSGTEYVRAKLLSNGGLANYQSNNTNLSDERTKKDIIPLESYWDKFKAIEIVKFKYKDQTHDDYNIGVIAQQVEEVAPEFVDTDSWNKDIESEEPLKSIYTADLHHATIKVLQEAMSMIEELSAKVAALEAR